MRFGTEFSQFLSVFLPTFTCLLFSGTNKTNVPFILLSLSLLCIAHSIFVRQPLCTVQVRSTAQISKAGIIPVTMKTTVFKKVKSLL